MVNQKCTALGANHIQPSIALLTCCFVFHCCLQQGQGSECRWPGPALQAPLAQLKLTTLMEFPGLTPCPLLTSLLVSFLLSFCLSHIYHHWKIIILDFPCRSCSAVLETGSYPLCQACLIRKQVCRVSSSHSPGSYYHIKFCFSKSGKRKRKTLPFPPSS